MMIFSIMNGKWLNYFWVSLATHLFLMFIIGLYFIPQKGITESIQPYLPSYIYHEISKTQQTINPKKTIAKDTLIKPHPLQKNTSQQLDSPQTQMQNIPNKTITHRVLLKLLHDEIAAKQIYPQNALMLNQKGTVTISFILYPNGSLQNIIIAKSSGISSLDLAALHAVEAISPLELKNVDFQQQETFTIDVIFS